MPGERKKRDPRERKFIDRLAHGDNVPEAGRQAGYSPTYNRLYDKARALEDQVEKRRLQLTKGRLKLTTKVSKLEGEVIDRAYEEVRDRGKAPDKGVLKLASETIERVGEAAGVRKEVAPQNIVNVLVDVGEAMKRALDWSGDVEGAEVVEE